MDRNENAAPRYIDATGVIHAEGPAGQKTTICGIALTAPGRQVFRGRIGCPECTNLIRLCKSVPVILIDAPKGKPARAALADTLENLVDRTTLAEILNVLAELCGAKAQHLRETWQDDKSASHWDRLRHSIETPAARAEARGL